MRDELLTGMAIREKNALIYDQVGMSTGTVEKKVTRAEHEMSA